jgi:hypothetical protein
MKECKCDVVLRADIQTTRCIGANPTHRLCGGTIARPTEKRVIEDDRPGIEVR